MKEKISNGFWGALCGAIIAIIIGFAWGGWVLGSNSQAAAENAVIERLAPICVAQFNQDPERDKKFKELKDYSSWKRDEYIRKQGWATMPGENEPDSRVADKCTDLIMQSNQ
jgi:hypothetical protein